MSNKHQAVLLIVNHTEHVEAVPSSLDQMIKEGNSTLLVMRKSAGHGELSLFNAVTSISQLDSEQEGSDKKLEVAPQSIIEKSFFKREASSFDALFHNGAFSKGKGVQVLTNSEEVAA
jgi:hypothetical protein